MELFVIGNGFDRGHGLPTRYLDFRTFLEDEHGQFLFSFEESFSIYPADTSDPYYHGETYTRNKNILWNELETNLANIDLERIIDDAVRTNLGLEYEYDIIDTLQFHHMREYQYIKEL
ncbi:AbiH family protein [Paenibacillus sp. NPDC057886]|uniref:AbiH family protein n=1 Tax=Paenibacillus sp. NPDC057886 TaxID=3346270 RepID=UPI0036806663